MIKAPKISSPELIDKVIQELQQGLIDNLAWLDYAFGRAQKITKIINGKQITFPSVFAGGEQYIDVSPDSNIGNFSFFKIEEPQGFEWIPNQLGTMRCPFGLIFWFDLRKVFPQSWKERNTESIKVEIIKALNLHIKLSSGQILINRIYESAQQIYNGYNISEVDNQFLMQPFAGFKFEGSIVANLTC